MIFDILISFSDREYFRSRSYSFLVYLIISVHVLVSRNNTASFLQYNLVHRRTRLARTTHAGLPCSVSLIRETLLLVYVHVSYDLVATTKLVT